MSGFTNLRFDDFKREDNTNLLTTNIVNDDGKVITPNKEHTWTAKVVNMKNNKFAGNYAVTISGDDISVSSKGMEKLLSGRYGLELWEEFGDNKTIYPSAGFIEFNIHRNGDDALEPDDKSIDITDVIEELHQAGLNVVIDKVNMLEPTAAPSVSSEIRDGKNHIIFNIPRGEQGIQGFRGPDGKPFRIKKTFPSIDSMKSSKGNGFEDGDFALISSNVNDEDNAKLYVWNGTEFTFVTDMSGAQGIQGPVGPYPVMNVVKVTKSEPGSNPQVKYTQRQGGYDVEYVLPQGPQGENWKESDKQEILNETKKYVEDAILNGKW